MKSLFTTITFFLVFSGTIISQQTNCPEGLLAYWKLDEQEDYSMFYDSYGSNNALSKSNALPLNGDGILKGAKEFNNNTIMAAPFDSLFNWKNEDSFSIELWMNTGVTADSEKVMINRYEGTGKMSWWLGYNSLGQAGISIRDNNGDWMEFYGKSKVNDNTWHHIAGIRDASDNSVKIYVDGNLENSMVKNFSGDFLGTSQIYIGTHAKYSHFDGWLDEVAVYKKALSKEEIDLHYQNALKGIDYCGSFVTSVEDESIVNDFNLYQNYPNPFNPSTTIKFSIPVESNVTLEIYSLLGEKVAVLLDDYKKAGTYNINFEAGDLSSGIYMYKIQADNHIEVKKMQLIK